MKSKGAEGFPNLRHGELKDFIRVATHRKVREVRWLDLVVAEFVDDFGSGG